MNGETAIEPTEIKKRVIRGEASLCYQIHETFQQISKFHSAPAKPNMHFIHLNLPLIRFWRLIITTHCTEIRNSRLLTTYISLIYNQRMIIVIIIRCTGIAIPCRIIKPYMRKIAECKRAVLRAVKAIIIDFIGVGI